jgi:hypothetical protein
LAIADGYIVALDLFDNRIYCYGKGPSATTVTASPKVSGWGDTVLVEGTVMDVSAGTTYPEQAGRFPNGVPAISDEDQEVWMEYVYQQRPMPVNAEGVEVVLTTLDPNGNTYELGRATTSDNGAFGCEVDLPVPGVYKIIATFEGSNAYGGSVAETYVTVTESRSASQEMQLEQVTLEQTTTTEAPLIATETAIIAAVAVACLIGVVAFLALRKRK